MNLPILFSRFAVGVIRQGPIALSTRNISMNSANFIYPSQCLYAEPLRARKKLDPGQLKLREEKRKRKLEREIRRLAKHAQSLKPIEEMQLPLHIQDQVNQRTRAVLDISPDEEERRALLLKQWSYHRQREHYTDTKMLNRIAYSQSIALDELRHESEELYQAAIKVDESLLPISVRGPTLTPPIKDYDSPDGDYQNTSFKWD
ncbi:hypothetical protein ONE63_007094 [Megalurothrips usitatus]|uniref:Large ribosomal subunit protein mL40 n=1 Tax=Megalurothrips usitatus TaxID=439358 RepID=A0AAV7XV50_9NEOP|nr:hypothetical protein ONE63_007094 [Megalurothrips usitatus]